MLKLPSGTVTFLFTDIEGSTRLLHELGAERYAEALAEHRRVLREAFGRHGGVEVDTQGDAFFVAFARASDAVAAATDGQRALDSGPVRVRMGLHTGDPVVTEEGYVGSDVHRAARIAAVGHGGQTLLSRTTRDLVDAEVRDLGQHRLKDLTAPIRLFQLGESEFPRLRTLHWTNLPVQATALVGRERELAEAGRLLHAHRLLTLTGPGGSGKTRLALQLAADAVEEFPDGVFWVPLQAVRDPDLVEAAAAHALGAGDRLADAVGDRRLLLVLDNLEHVLACSPRLAFLLERTRNAKMLITSREPLRIAGEYRYAVEPLPDDDASALFVERAHAVDHDFVARPEVAAICRRLDGLPLAIELAAARVPLLGLAGLLTRLDRTLPLLTGGSRDAPERQRTLEGTIAWSYDLLSESERQLFRRLAVFVGGSTVEAVQSVCGAELDALQSLVEKSLVRRWPSGRLGMLETIYEYARDRLEESGEADRLRGRHAEWMLALAESANLEAGDEGTQRHELITPERGNVRAALEWALAIDETQLGLRLAVALEGFWNTQAPSEGSDWFARLLERGASVSSELRARALRAYGSTIGAAGNFERAVDLYEQSRALFQGLGDERGVASVLGRIANELAERGERVEARGLAEQSFELHARTGNRRGQAYVLHVLGRIAAAEGRRDEAFELLQRSASTAAAAGDRRWHAVALGELAETALAFGQADEGERWARQSLSQLHQIGDRQNVVPLLALLAHAASLKGALDRAGRLWGAVEAEEARGDLGAWMREREPYAARVFEHGGPEFDRGRQAGRQLSPTDAVAAALSMD